MIKSTILVQTVGLYIIIYSVQAWIHAAETTSSTHNTVV